MNLLDNQSFLPGVITQITSEYSTGYDTSQFGTTEPVVIIGTAFDGPVGIPIPIYSPEHAGILFGKTYDSKTRREATLVAEVQNAYRKGNRTIYGVRISGKELSKNYRLAVPGPYRVKVAATFPSNTAKDYFMVYDDTTGQEKVTIYKPAARATVREKMEGMVEGFNAVMVNTIQLNWDLGFTKASPLIDVFEAINANASNNVLRMVLLDGDGNELSILPEEAKDMTLGSLLPGLYTIGRDTNLVTPITRTKQQVISDRYDVFENAPYEGFEGNLLMELVFNSDVSADLPIYAKNVQDFRDLLDGKITVVEMYDFLKTQGVIDAAFKKDKVDYEEVNISKFDMYKRLGSGFAETAEIVKITDGLYKRIPTPGDDKVVGIEEGIYSMLENSPAKYRVLTCGTAEDQLNGKLPALEEFKYVAGQTAKIFDGMVEATAKVQAGDFTEPKTYTFQLNKVSPAHLIKLKDDVVAGLYAQKVFQALPRMDVDAANAKRKLYPQGTLAVDNNNGLFIFVDNKFAAVESQQFVGETFVVDGRIKEVALSNGKAVLQNIEIYELFGEKTFFLVSTGDVVNVMKKDFFQEQLLPVGDLEGILQEDVSKTIVFAEDLHGHNNLISLQSSALDSLTIGEFVISLQEHSSLNSLFDIALSDDGANKQNDNAAEELKNIEGQEVITGFKENALGNAEGALTNELYERQYSEKTGVELSVKLQKNGADVNLSTLFSAFQLKMELNTGGHTIGEVYEAVLTDSSSVLIEDRTMTPGEYVKFVAEFTIQDVGVPADGIYEVIIENKEGTSVISQAIMQIGIGQDIEDVQPEACMGTSKVIGYDKNLRIPYRTTDNFARQLAQHCVYTSLKNSVPAHGFIGCQKLNDVGIKSVSDKVKNLLTKDFDLYAKRPNGRKILDSSNMPYPLGRAVSITFQQDIVATDDGYRYISNGASGYAGMASTLPLDQSSTNQPVNNASPMFTLSSYQLGQLTQKGFVTFRSSYANDVVITDGVTMAPINSPFRRFSVVKVIGAVEELLREASEPYIGKQNNAANRNALQTAIKSRLDKIKGTLIENYDFKLTQDPRIAKFSYIEIDYRIVPIYEIREVRNKLTVKEEL